MSGTGQGKEQLLNAIATVRTIARYPVKSMRGETLDTTDLTLQGVPDDRRYAFVQANSRSPFPWLTGRECPDLLCYLPRWEHSDTGRPRLMVTTPAGATRAVDSDELRRELEERSGRPLFLLRDFRGNYDIAQVSLITAGTVERICAEAEVDAEPGRFRATLYLDAVADGPFTEDAWVGRVLRIGDTARIGVTEPDTRCAMITLDPETGAPFPEVLAAVARLHDNRAGVYGVVLTAGPIRQGDTVRLE